MAPKTGLLTRFISWLEQGEKTPRELTDFCVARIAEADALIQAWTVVSPQPALEEGALWGIPFGAKDIFETRELPTSYGSPLYSGRFGDTDAGLITHLRRRGAILLGKTYTTAFAYFDAAPTRNPRRTSHTPGGSSSGSAAAVAAGMAPFTLGSQTQGSVLRPASYCGVAGFKPTRGKLALDGVLPFAPSLDTAGLFTQTAADMRLLWDRMGFPVEAATPSSLGVVACSAEPPMERAIADCVARLRSHGFHIVDIEPPVRLEELFEAVRTINDYEGARTHGDRWERHGEAMGAKLADLIRRGARIPVDRYESALETLNTARGRFAEVFAAAPVLITPAAPGPAPEGLAYTGDPRMNGPWTGLGTPAISVPMPVGDGELPLGMQLVAAPDRDDVLLAAAVRVEAAL